MICAFGPFAFSAHLTSIGDGAIIKVANVYDKALHHSLWILCWRYAGTVTRWDTPSVMCFMSLICDVCKIQIIHTNNYFNNTGTESCTKHIIF